MISCRILPENEINKYEKFLLGKKEALLFYSVKYLELLKSLIGDDYAILIAEDEDRNVVGAVPIFRKRSSRFGTVLNSSPFYGSHGGVLANDAVVAEKLLVEYSNIMHLHKCVAATIVGSPLEDWDDIYKKVFQPRFVDERIGMMTFFPYVDGRAYSDTLMEIYDPSLRRNIKKAIRNGVTVSIDNSESALAFLYDVHRCNMERIGGLSKPRRFFELIYEYFDKSVDFNVYIARMNGRKIAALLIFYYQGTVEYYTPVIVEEFRTFQPLSLIIYKAMIDSMERRFIKWNWGGTGLRQESLYKFKKKWGVTEYRYYYYTKVLNDKLLKENRETIMNEYNYYFVYPFGQVSDETN